MTEPIGTAVAAHITDFAGHSAESRLLSRAPSYQARPLTMLGCDREEFSSEWRSEPADCRQIFGDWLESNVRQPRSLSLERERKVRCAFTLGARVAVRGLPPPEPPAHRLSWALSFGFKARALFELAASGYPAGNPFVHGGLNRS